VTLVDTFDAFDLLDIPRGGIPAGEGDRFDAAAIVIGDAANDAALEEERAEPSLASLPFFVGFDEPEPLDPERVGLTWELVGVQRPRMWLRSPLIALLLHLAVLLLIVGWASTVNEDTPLIPIKLVIEQAPPEPEPQPVEQPPPPEHEAQSQPVQSAPAQPVPAPPAATPPVHAKPPKPPAKPTPVQPTPAKPTPAPTPPAHAQAQIQQEQLPPPKPAPISHPAEPTPATPPAPAPTPPPPHAAASVPVPSASTSPDGYLAYLVMLTGQHMNLLPRAFVGDRRGETVIRVAVRRDGVIDRVSVSRPSAYPDIDQRVEQMVAAVGRFPPVPNAFQGSPVELDLDFYFPEALQGH
jgi:TonB family protein